MTFPFLLAFVNQTVFRALKLYDTFKLIRAPIDSQSPALCRLTPKAAGCIRSEPDFCKLLRPGQAAPGLLVILSSSL